MNKTLLSIIIVNFNTEKYILECLSSVYQEIKKENLSKLIEVIVVDNGSEDKSVIGIKKNFPKVKLLINKNNKGYAVANNQGIKVSKGKYALLLNSDTQMIRGTLIKIIERLDKNNQVFGIKLLDKDGSIQKSIGYFPSLFRIFLWMFFLDDIFRFLVFLKPYHLENRFFYNFEQKPDWVSGAFFMIDKEIIKKCGYLDEKIFMYGEEVEWCYRIKKGGFQIDYLANIPIYHFKGGSQESGYDSGIVEEFKSIIYFYSKHKSLIERKIAKVILKFGALLRYFIFGIIMQNYNKKKIYEKAFQMVR